AAGAARGAGENACEVSDRTSSPYATMNAHFDLQPTSGTPLPHTRTLGTATLRLTCGVLVLKGDGSYGEWTTYAVPYGASAQVSTTIERGKYTVSGNTITFTDQTRGSRYSGTMDGTTLTQSVNGVTPLYERRS